MLNANEFDSVLILLESATNDQIYEIIDRLNRQIYRRIYTT